jgi:hypothetical protein
VRTGDGWISIAACVACNSQALQVLGFADDRALNDAGIRLFQLMNSARPPRRSEFADGSPTSS